MAFEDLHTHYVADSVDLPPAADLIAMLDDGETYETLAETFDCHWQTVAKRVTRSGLRTKTTASASTPDAVTDAEGGTTPDPSSASPLPLLLDYALDNDERFGIWGGLSERDRRVIKKAMQADAGVTRVPCPRCDQDFEDDAALARHISRTHDRAPAEDLPCPHCNHVGKGKQGLAVHISKSHSELRNAS